MARTSDKRQQARTLFITGQYTQKEIAAICKTTAKTITEWKQEDGWEEYSLSLLTTRENELKRMYKMLRLLNDDIDEKADIGGVPIDSKQADAILKLTQAIKNLEIETSIAEKVDVGMDFINMVRKEDVELSKTITKWFDVYLKSCIK